MIRVLLADDETLVRTGLRLLLGAVADIEIVGETADGRGAVDTARVLVPDVVLMDIRMPGLDGIEATRAILAERPATKVIMLTTFDLDEHVFAALEAGSCGYLLKDAEPQELIAALHTVVKGNAMLAPSVTARMISAFTRKRERSGALNGLTERELDVLRCVADGLSNVEIARRLHLGEATVKTHLGRVTAKLVLTNRVQAAIAYHRAYGDLSG